VFELAKALHTSPVEVLKWPAWMFFRARMWLSSNNQAQSDRAENAQAEAALRTAMNPGSP